MWNWFQKLCVSFVQGNFARNICNISFRVFYVVFFAGSCFAIFDQNFLVKKKKIFLSTNFFIYFDGSMFSDTAGEKASKVCSKSFLSFRLDAHQYKGLLFSKENYKFMLLSKNITSLNCCARILYIHLISVKENSYRIMEEYYKFILFSKVIRLKQIERSDFSTRGAYLFELYAKGKIAHYL